MPRRSRGSGLDALKAYGQGINSRTRSMGVALTSCTVPAAGKPTFTLAEDEMEMGVGIHGEPGRRRVKLASADAIAAEMLGAITGDLAPKPGQQAILLINGFGGTPSMELYLMCNAARQHPGRPEGAGRALPGRLLRDVAGDGRLLDHPVAGRGCRSRLVGYAAPHRRLTLGHVAAHQLAALYCRGRVEMAWEAVRDAGLDGIGKERPTEISAR